MRLPFSRRTGIILAVGLLTVLVGGYIILSSLNLGSLGSRASDNAPRVYEVAIPADTLSLAIANPAVGVLDFECDLNDRFPWYINQWKNENSLCNSGNDAGDFEDFSCAGFDFGKETDTSIFCFNKTTKRIRLGVDSSKMHNLGCTPHDTPANLASPGGYGAYITWNGEMDLNWQNNPSFARFGNLQKLYFSASVKTEQFESMERCPDEIPEDPLGGTRDANAFSYMSVIVGPVSGESPSQGGPSMFYQVGLYDNRAGVLDMNPPFLDCSFNNSDGGVILVGDSVKTAFNGPIANPENPDQFYIFDILPRMKQFLQQCRPGVDTSGYELKAMYSGIEMSNTSKLVMTIQDPRLRFEYTSSTPAPAEVPYPIPTGSGGTPTIEGFNVYEDGSTTPVQTVTVNAGDLGTKKVSAKLAGIDNDGPMEEMEICWAVDGQQPSYYNQGAGINVFGCQEATDESGIYRDGATWKMDLTAKTFNEFIDGLPAGANGYTKNLVGTPAEKGLVFIVNVMNVGGGQFCTSNPAAGPRGALATVDAQGLATYDTQTNCAYPAHQDRVARGFLRVSGADPGPDPTPNPEELPFCEGSDIVVGGQPVGRSYKPTRFTVDKYALRVNGDDNGQNPTRMRLCWAVAGQSPEYYKRSAQGIDVITCEGSANNVNEFTTRLKSFYEMRLKLPRTGAGGDPAKGYTNGLEGTPETKGFVVFAEIYDRETPTIYCSGNPGYNSANGIYFPAGTNSSCHVVESRSCKLDIISPIQ